jgi:hypothetical protein
MRASVRWNLCEADWEAFLGACPRATFYHSPAWYRANSETYGLELAPALIRLSNGEEALLPMAIRSKYRGLLREAVSGVGGGYGGLVTPGPWPLDWVQLAFREVAARFPELFVYSNPFEQYFNAPLPGFGFRMTETSTQALALADLEQLRDRYSRSRRKLCRKAMSEGYQIQTLPAEGELERFYRVYEEAVSGWVSQRWVRPKPFFERLLAYGGDRLRVCFVLHDGTPIGARLIASYGVVGVGLIYALKRGHDQGAASSALTEAALALCYKEGLRYYDFGASGSLAGIRYFKESFGAVPLPGVLAQRQGFAGRVLGHARTAALWGARLVHQADGAGKPTG